jgi:hypothetical protein
MIDNIAHLQLMLNDNRQQIAVFELVREPDPLSRVLY